MAIQTSEICLNIQTLKFWLGTQKKENIMDIQHNDLPQILTASEVANVLKISRAFAYQLMRTQQIRTVNIGRAVRVLREDLADFIKKSAPPKVDNP